jgi:hypothetical protein
MEQKESSDGRLLESCVCVCKTCSKGTQMTSDHPITRSPDPPISAGIAPLDVWIAIKTVLRRELGEREWEMWIQHARLWRVMSGDTLGVLVPRNGKTSFGMLRYMNRVRRLAAKIAYGVMVTVQVDMEQFMLNREAIEAMTVSDRTDEQLFEDWSETLDRQKVPEHFREQARTVDELMRDFPVSRRRKSELLEKWEMQNEWLREPFLEPPCSPLWEGFNG